MSDSKLAGKVVVITGASSGLGRAIAATFAEEKSKVVLLARKSGRLEDAAHEMEEIGAEVLSIPTDIGSHEDVEKAADEVVQKWDAIDLWINNAMTSVFCFAWDVKPEEFKRVTEVTYLGQVYGTMAALKHMRPKDKGKIIFIGSALAYRGIPLQSAYCGSKHAIQGFYDSLRTELMHEKSGITVSMAQLPAMNTPQFNWVKSCLPKKPRPMGKIFQPEVAARGVKFLALHNRRELFIGFPTFRTIIGNKIAPWYADRVLAKGGVKGQQTKNAEDPNRKSNLWEPIENKYAAHGDFNRQATDKSFTLTLSMNRGLVWTLIILLIIAIVLAIILI